MNIIAKIFSNITLEQAGIAILVLYVLFPLVTVLYMMIKSFHETRRGTERRNYNLEDE